MKLFASKRRTLFAAVAMWMAGAVFALAQNVQQPPPPAGEKPAAPQASAPREARFALVIGNDLYDDAALPTAAQDAGLIADTLKAAGFDVMGARNVDQDTLRASYREFLQKIAGAGEGGVAFIYVSGYGLQLEGENYFIPVGAKIERDSDLALNAVRISDLTRPLGSMQARTKIVVLDLAHKGPLGTNAQLAPGLAISTPEAGMLLAFNATPGTLAPAGKPPYGAYAQALAEMMREGGLQVGAVFDRTRLRVSDLTRSTQIPWESSTLEDPFVFFERKAGEPAPGASEAQLEAQRNKPLREMSPDEAYAAALARDDLEAYQEFLAAFPDSPYAKNVRGILAARREAATWQRASTQNTPNAYYTYLKRYPRGPHVADARRKLRRLSSPAEPPPNFELVAFDVPPPPEVEEIYFSGPEPEYFDPVAVPAVSFYAPPPSGWWSPPPPPPLLPEDYYYLPYSSAYAVPESVYVPAYVYVPPAYAPPPGYGYLPFVAAPAAVILGITAGRLVPRAFANRPGGFRPRVLPPRAIAPKQLNLVSPVGRKPLQARPATFQRNISQPRINPAQQRNLVQPNRPQIQPRNLPNQRNAPALKTAPNQRNIVPPRNAAGNRNGMQPRNVPGLRRNLQRNGLPNQRTTIQPRNLNRQTPGGQNFRGVPNRNLRGGPPQQFRGGPSQQFRSGQAPQFRSGQAPQFRRGPSPQFRGGPSPQMRTAPVQRQFRAPAPQMRAPVQQFRAPVQRSAPSRPAGNPFRRR